MRVMIRDGLSVLGKGLYDQVVENQDSRKQEPLLGRNDPMELVDAVDKDDELAGRDDEVGHSHIAGGAGVSLPLFRGGAFVLGCSSDRATLSGLGKTVRDKVQVGVARVTRVVSTRQRQKTLVRGVVEWFIT